MSSDNKRISVLFTYRQIFLVLPLLFCYFRHYWKAGTGSCAHPHANAESLTPVWWMSLAGGGSANQGLDEVERGFWWGQFPDGKRHETALSPLSLTHEKDVCLQGRKSSLNRSQILDISASRCHEIDFCCSATLSVRVCVTAGRQI